jgi:peptidoglycan-associated lipoprotein
MSAFGVPRQQLNIISYGEEQPAVAGQTEEAYALSRRVEIAY